MKKGKVLNLLVLGILLLAGCHTIDPGSSLSSNTLSSSSALTSQDSSASSLSSESSITDPDFRVEETPDDGYAFKKKHSYQYPAVTETDYSTTEDGLTFELDGDSYMVSDIEYAYDESGNIRLNQDGAKVIKRHKFNGQRLVIPPSYNGKPVTAIADQGFAERPYLYTVFLPSTITKIGAGSFSNCNIRNFYYDCESVEDLHARNWVFYPSSESNGMNVYFGPDVRHLPARLFYPLSTEPDKRTLINGIYFDDECCLESIGDYAFYKCEGLENLVLPDTVKVIGNYAFYDNDLLEMKLPSSLTSLGSEAFAFSKKMTHVSFNDKLSDLGERAFEYSALEQVDLSKTQVTSIPEMAFCNCPDLNRLVLPSGVVSIDDMAFQGCSSLTGLVLPSGLRSIGQGGFADCTSLKGLSLNAGLSHLGNFSFSGLSSLKKLIINTSDLDDFKSGNHVFSSLGGNGTIDIQLATARIPARLFYPDDIGIKARINLYFTKDVSSVGEKAFYGLTPYVFHGEYLQGAEIALGNDGIKQGGTEA